MFCLFVLAWEKQQNLRQGCNYLLELSSCKVRDWSIYPPGPVPHCTNVIPGCTDSPALLSSSEPAKQAPASMAWQEPRGQSRKSHVAHPRSERLTAGVESWGHWIVSHAWAETRSGPWVCDANTSGIAVSIMPTWAASFSGQRLSSLIWYHPCTLHSTRYLEGGAINISDENKFRINQSCMTQCFFYFLLSSYA